MVDFHGECQNIVGTFTNGCSLSSMKTTPPIFLTAKRAPKRVGLNKKYLQGLNMAILGIYVRFLRGTLKQNTNPDAQCMVYLPIH